MMCMDNSIEVAAPDARTSLIFPKPFKYWNQKSVYLGLENLDLLAEVQASNSDPKTYTTKPSCSVDVFIGNEEKTEKAETAPSTSGDQSNIYSTADSELAVLAWDISGNDKTEINKFRVKTEQHFRDQPFFRARLDHT